MRPFSVLLDAPTETKSRLQIAQLGDYNDKRYGGDFSITKDDVASWKRNLEYLPGKRALIDLDHRADRSPRNTEAAGWITDVGWDGEKPVADVEWTPIGKQAIEDKRYLFFSPTYGKHKTEDGKEHDNTLIGGALTNRPFLTGMPAITLASEENIEAAVDMIDRRVDDENHTRLLDALTSKQRDNLDDSDFAIPSQRAYPIHDLSHARNALARASGKPEEGTVKTAVYKKYPNLKPGNKEMQSADSRRAVNPEALKLLDLPEDADDKVILDKLTELTKPSEPEVKTLEQLLAEEGKIALDREEAKTLARQAAAGEVAQKRLHQMDFDNAFDDALKARKVAPNEKDSFQHFYTLDSEATLKMLDEKAPILPDKPSGAPAIDLTNEDIDPQELMQAHIYPGNFNLDQKVNAYLKDNKLPKTSYAKVLEQYTQGAIEL